MRKTQCDKCKAYAIYVAFGKEICAGCKESERSNVANAAVKKNPYKPLQTN